MSQIVELSCIELPLALARDCCRNGCGEVGYVARYIHANGTVALRWVCDHCEDFKTSQDIPYAWFHERFGIPIRELPLRADNSVDAAPWPECVVCDAPAEEMHHWAPRAIFPDWPKRFGLDLVVPLCKPCHQEWHDRMRDHGLRWPHELAPA